MADEKKFLDQTGVEYLWSKLSLEDYPNNETLITVLNAIDATKADKTYVTELINSTSVLYTEQELNESQKNQARSNIGAISGDAVAFIDIQGSIVVTVAGDLEDIASPILGVGVLNSLRLA